MVLTETVELNAGVKGDGPPLILLHGLFGAGDTLGGVRRRLAPDYEVHSLDLRNHGDSPHTDSMSYPEMASDVLAYMDRAGLEQAHLLGHSMGGKAAMELALMAPDRVQRLIVADIAPVAYEPHHDAIQEALEALDPESVKSRREADGVLAEHIGEKGVRQFLLTNLVPSEAGFRWRMNVPGILACYQQIMAAPSADGVYKGPTLFIRGGDSDYIQSSHQDAVLHYFPNAGLKVIPGVGHWLHAEKPELFARICQRFLAGEA
ncbi:MAG: alpha/beta fold hydrolase [Pseudomonadota bacterium]